MHTWLLILYIKSYMVTEYKYSCRSSMILIDCCPLSHIRWEQNFNTVVFLFLHDSQERNTALAFLILFAVQVCFSFDVTHQDDERRTMRTIFVLPRSHDIKRIQQRKAYLNFLFFQYSFCNIIIWQNICKTSYFLI